LLFTLYLFICYVLIVVYFSLLLASIRPQITDEKEAFIHQVLEIPFGQRKWKDLVTLDTLHAYRGGLEPTPVALKLNAYFHRHTFLLSCALPVAYFY